MRKGRYFLSRDNSAHWYVVPEAQRAEWFRWLELDEECEEAWATPTWAQRLDGAPERVTFTDWKEA